MKLRATRQQEGFEESEADLGRANHDRSAYKSLLLWLFGESIIGVFFFGLLNHLPDFAQVMILLVAIVVIWYHVDFPKRTTGIYVALLFWLPIALGLVCVAMWKITAEDVWVRLGIACICVRAVYRVINWAGVRPA
jgi:hypothetical protein